MAKILVVDDEPDYRKDLDNILTRAGHEVRTSANGHEALAVGVFQRPDVLIVDWLLKNDLHGLHVVDALRMVYPDIRPIVITGFSSQDLKDQAGRLAVLDYVEKPFDTQKILTVVSRVCAVAPPPPAPFSVAVVDVDGSQCIRYANGRAKELFKRTQGGSNVRTLSRVFRAEAFKRLADTETDWVPLEARSRPPLAWLARSWRPDGGDGTIMVLLAEEERHCQHYPVVRMLLGLQSTGQSRWPASGRILIVDEEDMVRRMLVAVYDRLGCTCHASGCVDEALSLFEKDADVLTVIVDFDIGDGKVALLIEAMRTIRPSAVIVGTSTMERSREFAEMGIPLFLPKPFTIHDLARMFGFPNGSPPANGI